MCKFTIIRPYLNTINTMSINIRLKVQSYYIRNTHDFYLKKKRVPTQMKSIISATAVNASILTI